MQLQEDLIFKMHGQVLILLLNLFHHEDLYRTFKRVLMLVDIKKFPWQNYESLLTKSGFQNVKTYIQSGNVIFKSLDEANEIEEIFKILFYHILILRYL